jgi:hypothetical protein
VVVDVVDVVVEGGVVVDVVDVVVEGVVVVESGVVVDVVDVVVEGVVVVDVVDVVEVGENVKPVAVAVPPGVVTLTFPLEAPEPTVAIIWVVVDDVRPAITPPIVTESAEAVKLVPVIVIVVP